MRAKTAISMTIITLASKRRIHSPRLRDLVANAPLRSVSCRLPKTVDYFPKSSMARSRETPRSSQWSSRSWIRLLWNGRNDAVIMTTMTSLGPHLLDHLATHRPDFSIASSRLGCWPIVEPKMPPRPTCVTRPSWKRESVTERKWWEKTMAILETIRPSKSSHKRLCHHIISGLSSRSSSKSAPSDPPNQTKIALKLAPWPLCRLVVWAICTSLNNKNSSIRAEQTWRQILRSKMKKSQW